MDFVETKEFIRKVSKILTDAELLELKQYLASNPKKGDVIQGSGGYRKLRWGYNSKSKREGSRVIYFFQMDDLIFLTDIYKKGEKEDLSQAEIKKLKELKKLLLDEQTGRLIAAPFFNVKGYKDMENEKTLGERLIEGYEEMIAYKNGKREGFRITTVEPKDELNQLRSKLDMTQGQFCQEFGLNINTVKQWSCGTRKPSRTARILFKMIDKYPNQVKDVLASAEMRH